MTRVTHPMYAREIKKHHFPPAIFGGGIVANKKLQKIEKN
jgi:hypothetical protein